MCGEGQIQHGKKREKEAIKKVSNSKKFQNSTQKSSPCTRVYSSQEYPGNDVGYSLEVSRRFHQIEHKSESVASKMENTTEVQTKMKAGNEKLRKQVKDLEEKFHTWGVNRKEIIWLLSLYGPWPYGPMAMALDSRFKNFVK